MVANGNLAPKRGAPGRHFALAMAVIFVLMILMVFLTRNKNTASPNLNPAGQHRMR
jgi:hypothetical protein